MSARLLHYSVFGLLVLLLACESRERTNPFDPRNPDTQGLPRILDARAGNGEVLLLWDLADMEDVLAVRVQRRYREDVVKDLTPSGLEPSRTSYLDESSQNGVRYEYRLELELRAGGRPVTAWDAATPGSAIPWLVDTDGGGLARLSPDARDVVLRIGEGLWFLDAAIDTATSRIWSVDYREGKLYCHEMTGRQRHRVDLPGARAVAVDSDGENVWAASFGQGRVERRRMSDAGFAWADSAAGFVEALLASPFTGVWVCNREGTLRLYQDDARRIEIEGLDRPVALASGSGSEFLVLERAGRRVRRFDPYGIPIGMSPRVLGDPVDLCSDGRRGAWVADPGRGGLVHLGGDRLEEEAFVPFPGALGVTWDPADSLLWVVGDRRVEIRTADGAFVSGSTTGARPIKVAVVHAPESP